MRSFFKLPGTALLAVAALFAVVTTTSTANAFLLRDTAPVAAALNGPASIENVAVSRWEAWQARRDIARGLRSDCRQNDARSERRECFREAYGQLRNMRSEAREAYRECRNGGGSRRDCRQAARSYWVDQAAGSGGSDSSDIPGDDAPRSDD